MSKSEVAAKKHNYNAANFRNLFRQFSSHPLDSHAAEEFISRFCQDIKEGAELIQDENPYEILDCEDLKAAVRDFVNQDPAQKEQRKELCRNLFKDFALKVNQLLDKENPENKYFKDNEGNFARLFFYYAKSLADIIDMQPEDILKGKDFDNNKEAFCGLLKLLFDKSCFELDADGYRKIKDKIGHDNFSKLIFNESQKYIKEGEKHIIESNDICSYAMKKAGVLFVPAGDAIVIDEAAFKNSPSQLASLVFSLNFIAQSSRENDSMLFIDFTKISNVFYDPSAGGNENFNPLLLQEEHLAHDVLDCMHNCAQMANMVNVTEMTRENEFGPNLKKLLRAAVKFGHFDLIARINEIDSRICLFARFPGDLYSNNYALAFDDDGDFFQPIPLQRVAAIQRYVTQDVKRGDFIDLFCREDLLGIFTLVANSETANKDYKKDENLFYAKMFCKTFAATTQLLSDNPAFSSLANKNTIRRIASYEARRVVGHFYQKKEAYQNLGSIIKAACDAVPGIDTELLKETFGPSVNYYTKIDFAFMSFLPREVYTALVSGGLYYSHSALGTSISDAILQSSQKLVERENSAIIDGFSQNMGRLELRKQEAEAGNPSMKRKDDKDHLEQTKKAARREDDAPNEEVRRIQSSSLLQTEASHTL